ARRGADLLHCCRRIAFEEFCARAGKKGETLLTGGEGGDEFIQPRRNRIVAAQPLVESVLLLLRDSTPDPTDRQHQGKHTPENWSSRKPHCCIPPLVWFLIKDRDVCMARTKHSCKSRMCYAEKGCLDEPVLRDMFGARARPS